MSDLHPITIRARHFYKSLGIYKVLWWPPSLYRDHQTDVFVIWFPKTGGTWMRLLLSGAVARLTGQTPASPLDLEALWPLAPELPRLRATNDDEPHWKRADQLRRDKSRYRDRKVILLCRDPRDAVVSLYFQKAKRWKVIDTTLSRFLWEPVGSLRTMIEFYNVWARSRAVPAGLHLVRYEDLHAAPEETLRGVLDFAGFPPLAPTDVAAVVEESSFSRVRQRELAGDLKTSRLRPGIPGDPESYKTRQGRVGGHVDYLTPEEVKEVTSFVRETMDPWYGYPLPVDRQRVSSLTGSAAS